jgi:hypothetical protein
MANASAFRTVFAYLMGLVALTWVWAVALILAWPSEKSPQWEPGLRLVAVCADGVACSIPYGQLAEARAAGTYQRLGPPEPIGEVAETDAWLRWRTEADKPWQYEVTRSSWNFETRVRYNMDGDTPVLVELRRYDVRVLLYAAPLALFTLAGIFFRTLRR